MELRRLYEALVAAAAEAGIAVRADAFGPVAADRRAPRGGLCTLRGRRVIVVDGASPLPDRIALVASSLSGVTLDVAGLHPVVRATIGAYRRSDPAGAIKAAARPLARGRGSAKGGKREPDG